MVKDFVCLGSDYNVSFLKLSHLFLLFPMWKRPPIEKHTSFMLSALGELPPEPVVQTVFVPCKVLYKNRVETTC